MKIISKQKDYYDNFYAGEDRIWKREKSSMILPFNDKRIYIDKFEKNFLDVFPCIYIKRKQIAEGKVSFYADAYNLCFLFFCGDVFPFFLNDIRLINKYLCEFENSIFWNEDSFMKYKKESEKEDKIYGLLNSDKKVRASFDISNIPRKFYSLGLEFDSPIVLIKRCTSCKLYEKKIDVIVNQNLKELGFQKVIKSQDAFLKIDSYLSNELADKNQEEIKISDSVKISSHGFDKFSFRKQKSNK